MALRVTRGSIFFAKKMDRRVKPWSSPGVKPGNDVSFMTQ
jgi:hypothetical protein